MENLRAYTDAKIVVTFLGNINNGTGEEMGTEERHNAAMTGAASDVLTENILAFVGEFGFDGVSFDYEYPSAASSFENFTGYLEKLHTAMDGSSARAKNCSPPPYPNGSWARRVLRRKIWTYSTG